MATLHLIHPLFIVEIKNGIKVLSKITKIQRPQKPDYFYNPINKKVYIYITNLGINFTFIVVPIRESLEEFNEIYH